MHVVAVVLVLRADADPAFALGVAHTINHAAPIARALGPQAEMRRRTAQRDGLLWYERVVPRHQLVHLRLLLEFRYQYPGDGTAPLTFVLSRKGRGNGGGHLSGRGRGSFLVACRVRSHRREEVALRSEEHTSELQSHSFISYAVFFFNETPTTEFYTLPLHDALPIWWPSVRQGERKFSGRLSRS